MFTMFVCSNFHWGLCSISASFMKSSSGCWEEQSVLYIQVKSTCRGYLASNRSTQDWHHLSDVQRKAKRKYFLLNDTSSSSSGCWKFFSLSSVESWLLKSWLALLKKREVAAGEDLPPTCLCSAGTSAQWGWRPGREQGQNISKNKE